ncbi:MAG: hypothetical protein ACC656_14260, partial [Candidatus Heimdallarchaeota archaeon]
KHRRNLVPLDPSQTVISKLFVYDDKLYVGLADYRVSIINLKSFNIITEIKQDLWEVKDVYVDSQNIYVGTLNEHLSIFNHNYELVRKLKHRLGVISLEVDDNYIYTGSHNGKVLIWNKVNYDFVNSLDNHLTRVNEIVVHDENIYTGDGFSTEGGRIRKWDKAKFNLISEFNLPPCKRVNCMVIDSSYLYVGHGGPGEIRIIDLNTEFLIKKIETRSDINSISLNDKFMLIAFTDKIQIYDKSSFKLVKEISEHGREVNDCIFQDSYIIYSSRDQVKIIDSQSFELLKCIKYK